VTLIGASNLKYSAVHFKDENLNFENKSVPGWLPTPPNIEQAKKIVEESVSNGAAGFVFDLLGNSSVRFEQIDGSTSLPFKAQGKFHLGGKIVVSPPEIFRKSVEAIKPILLAAKGTPSVIVPPLPRYIFATCCNDDSHCINAWDEPFREETLGGLLGLRTQLIQLLATGGITHFRVMDTCCTTDCHPTATAKDRLVPLRSATAKDGVHFIATGYKILADRCVSCLRKILSSEPRPRRESSHYWRGFRSRNGSSSSMVPPRSSAARGKAMTTAHHSTPSRGWPPHRGSGRGGTHWRHFHPYSRKRAPKKR
jgi:hypothetical protein